MSSESIISSKDGNSSLNFTSSKCMSCTTRPATKQSIIMKRCNSNFRTQSVKKSSSALKTYSRSMEGTKSWFENCTRRSQTWSTNTIRFSRLTSMSVCRRSRWSKESLSSKCETKTWWLARLIIKCATTSSRKKISPSLISSLKASTSWMHLRAA